MKIPLKHIRMSRVVNEDGDWLLLEVPKHDNLSFTIDQVGRDRFMSVLFVKSDGVGGVNVYNPFEEA